MLAQDHDKRQETPPRLLVDAMLGRLARWLRLLGFDAEYWREGSDEELIAAAATQGRIVITRDRALAGRHGVRALYVTSETLEEQIEEVRARLGAGAVAFSRCSECNGELVDLDRSSAEGRVPPYVWQTQAVFRECSRCGRIYWKGTHWPALLQRIGKDCS